MCNCGSVSFFQENYHDIISLYRERVKGENNASLEALFAKAVSNIRNKQDVGIEELEMLLDVVFEVAGRFCPKDIFSGKKIRCLIKMASSLYVEYLNGVLEKIEQERRSTEDGLRRGIVAAQENERHRVSVMLHDDVVQSMASVLLQVQMISMLLKREQKDVHKQLVEIEGVIRDVITNCRLVAMDRDLFLLEKAGFVPTVESYILNFENKYGIRVNFNLRDTELIGPSMSAHIFYVIKEALTNVQKHAEASTVLVKLGRKGRDLVLAVEDNGKGFLPDIDNYLSRIRVPSSDHFGLYCIEQRAKLLEGKFCIKMTPGSGTKLVISVPVNWTGPEMILSEDRRVSPWIKSES